MPSFFFVAFVTFPSLVPIRLSAFPRAADAGKLISLVTAAASCSWGSFIDFLSALFDEMHVVSLMAADFCATVVESFAVYARDSFVFASQGLHLSHIVHSLFVHL